ncbi:unnamed protein product [Fraxinus pennsylvanica]|uniref:Pectinesterase inhibitor domain-containing protein n=1 Tax=Fraxinus pennsylvanica TaxID=56036 RepID=A0AAD1ZUW5_9LAMI|nr:unnamed protein product [Fraxinus pennsylvanica]
MTLMFHVRGIPQEKDQNFVETICSNTPSYQLCISTLRADHTSIKEDASGLGLIMVVAMKAKAKEMMKAIKKLRAFRPNLKDVWEVLRWDPKVAANNIADSSMQAGVCKSNLNEVKSSLTGLNDAMYDLCEVAKAIIINLL